MVGMIEIVPEDAQSLVEWRRTDKPDWSIYNVTGTNLLIETCLGIPSTGLGTDHAAHR